MRAVISAVSDSTLSLATTHGLAAPLGSPDMDFESPNFFHSAPNLNCNSAYFHKYSSNSRVDQSPETQNYESINLYGFELLENSLSLDRDVTTSVETSVCYDCGDYNCDFGSVLNEDATFIQACGQKETSADRSLVPVADFETDDFLELYQVNSLGCDQLSNSSNNSVVSSGSKDSQYLEERCFPWTPIDVENSESTDVNYLPCEDGESDSKGRCYYLHKCKICGNLLI